jgi:hypothetical protein
VIAATQPVVGLCNGHQTAAPKTWTLACADGNFWFTGLKWKDWGAPKATATGTAHANDCTPYCAAGHFHTHAAVVTLSGTLRCSGRRQYAKLVVSYPGTKSAVFKPLTEALGCKYP